MQGAAVFGLAVGAILILAFHFILCSQASDVAQEKGFDKSTWFHMCFWTGPIAFIIVAAMPDMKLREQQREMIRLQEKTVALLEKGAASPVGSGKHEEQEQAYFTDLPSL